MKWPDYVAPLLALLLAVGSSCQQDSGPPAEKGSGSTVSENQNATDLALVDDYLRRWDEFAQGANDLAPVIEANQAEFESSLAGLLRSGDRRAPARMVFYPVVQVGGSINADSELGQAVSEVVGDAVPVVTSESGERGYFAGHLYFWWLREHGRYEAFPLFDEWRSRDFAQTVAIPMYQAVAGLE